MGAVVDTAILKSADGNGGVHTARALNPVMRAISTMHSTASLGTILPLMCRPAL